MNTVILVGTEHAIQLGEAHPTEFESVLVAAIDKFAIRAIAEEIADGAKTIALSVSEELKLKHLYADPSMVERVRRKIPTDIALTIQRNYLGQYPEIGIWPREPDPNNLPKEVWEAYANLNEVEHRMREQVWFENILAFDTWPLLFICGANHFSEFSRLLCNDGVNVEELHPHWKGNGP